MTSSFFSKVPDVGNCLIEIRNSDYNVSKINGIGTDDFAQIKLWVLNSGEKILRTHLNDETDLLKAQRVFNAAIDRLWAFSNKFPAISFSCQLLEYYTIISDDDFKQNLNFQEFHDFLVKNSSKFGVYENNLFVMEHKLITMYRDLTHFLNAEAPVADMQARNDFILEQLNGFSEKIAQWLSDAPDNTFVQYLSFVHSYLAAKALELKCTKTSESLSEDESRYFKESSVSLLQKAFHSLNNIDNALEFAKSQEAIAASGMEFSFGRDVLIKLAAPDIESIKMSYSMHSS